MDTNCWDDSLFISDFILILRYLLLGQRLRDIALTEEIKISNDGAGIAPTLLGLANSLSRFVLQCFIMLHIK